MSCRAINVCMWSAMACVRIMGRTAHRKFEFALQLKRFVRGLGCRQLQSHSEFWADIREGFLKPHTGPWIPFPKNYQRGTTSWMCSIIHWSERLGSHLWWLSGENVLFFSVGAKWRLRREWLTMAHFYFLFNLKYDSLHRPIIESSTNVQIHIT